MNFCTSYCAYEFVWKVLFIKKNKLWESWQRGHYVKCQSKYYQSRSVDSRTLAKSNADCIFWLRARGLIRLLLSCSSANSHLNTQAQIGNMFFSLIGKFSFFKFEYISFLFLNTLIFFTIIGIFSSWTNFLFPIKIFSFF